MKFEYRRAPKLLAQGGVTVCFRKFRVLTFRRLVSLPSRDGSFSALYILLYLRCSSEYTFACTGSQRGTAMWDECMLLLYDVRKCSDPQEPDGARTWHTHYTV